MSAELVQTARIDARGLLLHADPVLARLNERAGGRLDAAVAVPAIASVVHLARSLGVTVARPGLAADGDGDLDLWIRASPGKGEVALTVSGWRRRPRRCAATASVGQDDFARADADWHWRCDAALRLTHLSPAVSGLLGTDARSLLGEPLTRLLVFEEERGSLPVLAAMAERRRFDGQPATLRGGGPERFRIRATPMTDGAGRFAGFSGSAVRIDTRAPSAEPSTPVEEGAFARRLDNALRAPLGRIIANADDLHAQNEGPLRAEYAEYATDIASAGRHLLSLVDDLVDLHAIERPDFQPERDAIDLADLARRAAGLLSVRAAGKQVRIDRPSDAESMPATGEFRRVLQILVNLVGNALRYSPPGSVVTLSAEHVSGRAAIAVTDTGKGIPQDDQARIFDKFERVDPSEAGGTGLGLYIARRLARAMGGDLTVVSAPGQGSCFKLDLPAT